MHVGRTINILLRTQQINSHRIRFQYPGQVDVNGSYSYFTASLLYLLPSFVPRFLSSLIWVHAKTHTHTSSHATTQTTTASSSLDFRGRAEASVRAALKKWTLTGSPLPLVMIFGFLNVLLHFISAWDQKRNQLGSGVSGSSTQRGQCDPIAPTTWSTPSTSAWVSAAHKTPVSGYPKGSSTTDVAAFVPTLNKTYCSH